MKVKKWISLPLLMSGLFVFSGCQSAELVKQGKEAQIQKDQSTKEQREYQKNRKAAIESVKEEAEAQFYYQQLIEQYDKDLYALILYNAKALLAGKESLRYSSTKEKSDAYYISYQVLNDFPQYFWLYEGSIESMLNQKQLIDLSKQMEETADQIVAKMPKGSDFDKARYLYEFIIKHTTYNQLALEKDSAAIQNQTIVSVLRDQLSVCSGYSRTFQYLCKKAGINTIYVEGKTSDTLETGYGHAWNLVQLDGKWYGVDATWGDPAYYGDSMQHLQKEIDYSWFGLPESFFAISHFPEEKLFQAFQPSYSTNAPIQYPSFTDNSLNDYVRQGAYFESYDPTAITNLIASRVQSGEKQFGFQFAQRADYDAMVKELANDDNFIARTIFSYQSNTFYRQEVDALQAIDIIIE